MTLRNKIEAAVAKAMAANPGDVKAIALEACAAFEWSLSLRAMAGGTTTKSSSRSSATGRPIRRFPTPGRNLLNSGSPSGLSTRLIMSTNNQIDSEQKVMFAPSRTGMSRTIKLSLTNAEAAELTGKVAAGKPERFPVLRPYFLSVGVAIVALVALGVFVYYRDPTCANSVFASLNSSCHWPK